MKHSFRQSDIISTIWDGSFTIVATNVEDDNIRLVFEKLLINLENDFAEEFLEYNIHIGVCSTLYKTPEDMIEVAKSELKKSISNSSSYIAIDLEHR
jgi:GGDEF domain-containing protein